METVCLKFYMPLELNGFYAESKKKKKKKKKKRKRKKKKKKTHINIIHATIFGTVYPLFENKNLLFTVKGYM